MPKIKERIWALLVHNNSPHEIAFGAAIGVFICILPVYGLHTALVILAVLFIPRANKIAMLLGTNISLPPTVPIITLVGYNIGRNILGQKYPVLDWAALRLLSFKDLPGLYLPLFVGSVALGLCCALFFYLLVFLIAVIIERKKKNAG